MNPEQITEETETCKQEVNRFNIIWWTKQKRFRANRRQETKWVNHTDDRKDPVTLAAKGLNPDQSKHHASLNLRSHHRRKTRRNERIDRLWCLRSHRSRSPEIKEEARDGENI